MRLIDTLSSSGATEAVLYKDQKDDGLSVKYSPGRMDWYRVDTREWVDIYTYSYWA